jgi:hypothetical protein
MRRIVERSVLTKDNRVRDRGTLNRFDIRHRRGRRYFHRWDQRTAYSWVVFLDPMRCSGRPLSTRLNTISQRYTRLRRNTARVSQRRRE